MTGNDAASDRDLLRLSMALGQVARAYRAGADHSLANVGLSQATALPLVMIARLDAGAGVRPGSVAEALGMDPASVVRVIEHLIAAALVERRDDARDRRAKLLHVTAAGSARVQQLEAALTPFRRTVFSQVAPADVAACLRVYDALSSALAAHQPE